MTRTLTGALALVGSCAAVVSALVSAQAPSPADLELLNAVRRGQCRDVEGLLRKKANPNARDDEGATALIRAALVCEPRVLTQLLDRGADINAADAQGRTPLVMAIERDPPSRDFARRQVEVIKLLLARKADPAMKDVDGNTVVHYAARQRNVEVLKMMLALGVPADARNKDGATPLFVAASDGRELQNAEVLIAAGADINSVDNHGMTVLAVARQGEIATLLASRGARAAAPRPAPARPSAAPSGDLRAPIAGVTFEQWARANGLLTAEVPLETVLAPLKIDKARWERAHEQWTERLAANTLTLGTDYAKIFRAAMEEEAARRGEPGTAPGGSPEPMPFERWVEIQEASSAASERVPALYGLNRADFTRVQSWWNQRLKAKEVDQALYDRLSAKYEKQFAAAPPAPSRPVLREGALENNREPVSLEQWVEMQQAAAAAQTWTLKKHGLTMGQWIRATGYWGKRFNEAVLSIDSGTPAERAAKRQMYTEHQRLSELYRKKYAQGVPW